jgi:hypothetical protein
MMGRNLKNFKLIISILILILFTCYSFVKGPYNEGDFIVNDSPYALYFSFDRIRTILPSGLIQIILYYLLFLNCVLLFLTRLLDQLKDISEWSSRLNMIFAWMYGLIAIAIQINLVLYLFYLICSILPFLIPKFKNNHQKMKKFGT